MKRFLGKIQYYYVITLIILLGLATACSDNDPIPVLPGENGFFIVNEGAWGIGDASISFFDKSTSTITNDVFFNATGENLGDQAQSMTIAGDLAFIVVQNSGKIEVFDLQNNESVATMGTEEGIISPRYLLVASDNKAYVSDWGVDGITGTIKVVNLDTYKVTKTIDAGSGTNKMLLNGTKLYAANAGGWGADRTIAIIDTSSDTKIGSIEVGDNPNSLVLDHAGNLWVSASGRTVYDENWNIDPTNSTTGSISKINSSGEVELTFDMPKELSAASNLQINQAGDMLYFLYDDGVYQVSTDETTVTMSNVVETLAYGMSIDPSTDNIIVLQAPDFSSAGTMYRYTITGSLIDQYEVGVGPNSAAF